MVSPCKCPPSFLVNFKRPWALTRENTVIILWSLIVSIQTSCGLGGKGHSKKPKEGVRVELEVRTCATGQTTQLTLRMGQRFVLMFLTASSLLAPFILAMLWCERCASLLNVSS